jgi:SAM-dependent methyltransferase
LHLASQEEHFFWDSPVPVEHTFECTYDTLLRICRPHLELDHAFGVSMGWNVPGWGALLQRLPWEQALAVMHRLDQFATRRPRLADFVVTVWRPRPSGTKSAAASTDDGFVRPTDVVYPGKVQVEAAHWAQVNFSGGFSALVSGAERAANEAYTGDPDRSWIEDLAERGPFRDAAALGCDEEGYERHWLRCGASERLDVYELSEGVIRKVREGLGLGWWETHGPRRRVRFIRADLNVARLPENRYDVIWSSGCLHHVTDLEHLFADYVGEPRMQFTPGRLARINVVLDQVPARYRRVDAVVPPTLQGNEDGILRLSPFCGVRSDEILPLAEARFEIVHKAVAGALFPLNFVVDIGALEREAPELLAKVHAAEKEALREPGLQPCGVYVVLRKRARPAPRTAADPAAHG